MWFKVDDTFWSHPKVIQAGNAAIGLWARGGSYAAQHLTDGFIPASIAKQLGSAGLAAKLVEAGLWAPEDGGYLMHDWPDYQPTRATALQRRESNAERQRTWRERHSQPVDNPARQPVDNESYSHVAKILLARSENSSEKPPGSKTTESQVNGTRNAVTNSVPSRTRPVPNEGERSQQQRGRHARDEKRDE